MQPTTVFARVCPSGSASSLDLPAGTLRVSSAKTSITFQAGHSKSTPNKRLTEQGPARVFNFEQCFTADATNADVCSALASQVVQACFTGQNVAVWAYGESGTGKTHTMFGGSRDEGLISRMLKQVMGRISPSDNVQVNVSHYEIYNETVRDLLSPDTDRRRLRVLDDRERKAYVEGLTTYAVASESDALAILAQGMSRRTSALADNGTYRTSCSHSVFQMELIKTQISSSTGSCAKLSSRILFVDLAGAERSQRSRARSKEASTINASLMTLRLVVNALTPVSVAGRQPLEGDGSKPTVPYRNSLLTWLTMDTFVANYKTFFIATVSADGPNAEETLSTLRMAEKIKSLMSPVSANEHPISIVTRAVTKEIQALNQELVLDPAPKSGRKTGRFSVEALDRLNHRTAADYEDEIRSLKEKVALAEKDSRERAELLWEAFESLRQVTNVIPTTQEEIMEEARKEAMQEAQKIIAREKEDWNQEIECLAEHASALTIQGAWRKYQLRRAKRNWGDEKRRERNRYEGEIQSLQGELSALKIESMQQYRTCQTLESQLEASRKDAEARMAQLRKTTEATIRDKEKEIVHLRELVNTGKANDANSAVQASELKRVQTELDSTRAALRLEGDKLRIEADKNEKLQMEAQRLKEEVDGQEKQLKALQESIQQMREQAEKDAQASRDRIAELESMIEHSTASTQREIDDRQRKVEELETLVQSHRLAEAESRRLRETETEALREHIKETELKSLEEIQRLTRQLQERGDDETKRASQELAILRTKIGTLELKLETNKAVTEKEIQERDRRLREVERLNEEVKRKEREEVDRKNREIETMELLVRRLQKELETTKASTSRDVKERDKKLKELEHALHEQLTATQQRSVGASFMQYRRDSKRQHDSNRRLSTISVIPPAASTLLMNQSSAPSHLQQENLLCVRVDVESFDERSALFYPCTSAVMPEDPNTHLFNVRAPLYDLKKARWTRIRIKVLHGSVHRVEEINSICLEHHLPAGRSIMHKLRVVKTERGLGADAGVQAVVCDWDSSTSATAAFVEDGVHTGDIGHQCFCFQKLEESGPMTLHATFIVDEAAVHWEYPLRFRNKSAVIEKIPGLGPKILLSRRASDEIKHEYLNSSWFSLENESGNVHAGPVQNGQRIIAFSGYLQKYQSHRGGKVQRWFVFAPPFLFCYQDAVKAAEDFTKERALPHSANRAMRVAASTKVLVHDAASKDVEKVEFSVVGTEKTWHLQAANREDLDRWTSALTAWISREKEISPHGFDRVLRGGGLPEEIDEV